MNLLLKNAEMLKTNTIETVAKENGQVWQYGSSETL